MENLQTTKTSVEDYREFDPRMLGWVGTQWTVYERSSFGGVFFRNSIGDVIVMSPMALDPLTGLRVIISDIIPKEGKTRVHKAIVPCWAWDPEEHLKVVLGAK